MRDDSNQNNGRRICGWIKYIDAFIAIVTFPFLFPLSLLIKSLERKRKCPHCHKKGGMKNVNFIRATVINAKGQRAPDAWGYYTCELCHAKFKYHRGEYKAITENEWERYCSNKNTAGNAANTTDS